jgi:hypothetical protein
MMLSLVKMVHLLALGLWAGAMVFFSFFTALPIIGEWPARLTQAGHWMGIQDAKQGTRAAGEVLDLLFQRYFPFQLVVGLVAVATALWLATLPGWLAKARALVLVMALALTAANWFYLAPAVHQARAERYGADAQVAAAAEASFGSLHTRSLLADMAALLLVLIALGSAAWLPAPLPPPGSP